MSFGQELHVHVNNQSDKPTIQLVVYEVDKNDHKSVIDIISLHHLHDLKHHIDLSSVYNYLPLPVILDFSSNINHIYDLGVFHYKLFGGQKQWVNDDNKPMFKVIHSAIKAKQHENDS